MPVSYWLSIDHVEIIHSWLKLCGAFWRMSKVTMAAAGSNCISQRVWPLTRQNLVCRQLLLSQSSSSEKVAMSLFDIFQNRSQDDAKREFHNCWIITSSIPYLQFCCFFHNIVLIFVVRFFFWLNNSLEPSGLHFPRGRISKIQDRSIAKQNPCRLRYFFKDITSSMCSLSLFDSRYPHHKIQIDQINKKKGGEVIAFDLNLISVCRVWLGFQIELCTTLNKCPLSILASTLMKCSTTVFF